MRWPILVFLVVLAGCGGRPGGVRDVISTYKTMPEHVKMADDTYRLFESGDGMKLMTTPSLGKVSGQGFVRGATLGLGNINTPEPLHRAAANEYLRLKGRAGCRASEGEEIIATQYEFLVFCGDWPPKS